MPVATKKRASAGLSANGPKGVRKRKTAECPNGTEFQIGGSAADDCGVDDQNRIVSSNTNGVGGENRFANDAHYATSATKQAATGDCHCANERYVASRGKKQSATELLSTKSAVPTSGSGGETDRVNDGIIAATCRDLQELQRRRVQVLGIRQSIDRQTESLVANTDGYSTGLEEKDRKERFVYAKKLIKAIDDGGELTVEQQATADKVGGIVLAVRMGRNGFETQLLAIENEMVRLAKTLPVAKWCESQRGFGLKSLAVIIGETGDLSLYAGPAKVWKRLGLAPINGKMGSTWKRKGGLSAGEWTEAGYSPRRRAVMYVISECLLRQNDGDYRKRYDEAKASKLSLESEDWPKIRCHLHGMLLSTKLLIKHLWKQWNKC